MNMNMNMSIDYNNLFSKINKFICAVCSNITYTKEELILEICPVCYIEYKSQTDLNQSFHLEVSNPITSKVLPYCIVITDSFKELNPIDYSQTAILHVGVSNSKSEVYNFWSKYKIDNPNKEDLWKYVINIPLLSIDFESFDSLLSQSLTSQKSKYPKYDQIDNNCYAFVCRFLNELKYLGRSSWTKEDLALNLIEEMIINVDKYSSICKKLLMDDHYIVEKKSDEVKISYSVCDICNEMVQVGDRFRCEECKDFDLCSLCYSQYGHNHKMVKI